MAYTVPSQKIHFCFKSTHTHTQINRSLLVRATGSQQSISLEFSPPIDFWPKWFLTVSLIITYRTNGSTNCSVLTRSMSIYCEKNANKLPFALHHDRFTMTSSCPIESEKLRFKSEIKKIIEFHYACCRERQRTTAASDHKENKKISVVFDIIVASATMRQKIAMHSSILWWKTQFDVQWARGTYFCGMFSCSAVAAAAAAIAIAAAFMFRKARITCHVNCPA